MTPATDAKMPMPAYRERFEQVLSFVGQAANQENGITVQPTGSVLKVDHDLVVTSQRELARLLQADKAELAAFRRHR